MERIAVILDIHGNLEALKAVLDDIRNRHVDKIICLGDILAKGRHFHECIELVKDNCDIVIQGNCDWYFSHMEHSDKEKENNRIQYIRSHLSTEDLEYVMNLPYCYELKISGNLVRFFHAAPDKIYRFVGDIASLDDHYSLFLPSENTPTKDKADVVVYGHIHKQYLKKVFNRTIINVGSVGNNFEVYRNKERDGKNSNTTKATYVIISGYIDSDTGSFSYEFINVNYDIEKELSTSKDAYEYEGLEKELLEGRYRDISTIKDLLIANGLDFE